MIEPEHVCKHCGEELIVDTEIEAGVCFPCEDRKRLDDSVNTVLTEY